MTTQKSKAAKAKADAELKVKEEAELKAKEEAELKAKEEAELKATEEAEAASGTEGNPQEGTEEKPVVLSELDKLKQAISNYIKVMSPEEYVRPEIGVNNQLNMGHVLSTVINLADKAEFKECFDFINDTFESNPTGCFSSQYLMRYLPEWTGSEQALNRYVNLVDTITLLCSKKSRKENKLRLNIDKALDPEKTGISEEAAANVRGYYNYK